MSKGLEALERVHKFDSDLHIIYKELRDNSKDYKIIEKELKALEIIRKCCLVAKYPNNTYELSFSTKIDIYKEEYELLKEVL